MKTILVLAGTRPEIIKMAPIIRELRARQQSSSHWQSHFCFSGQHLDIALPFFEYFAVAPDSRLDVMTPGQSLGQLTANAALQLDSFFNGQENVCAALVQGDTTTAFVAALSAFYHHIPVAHVEAGLRTSTIQEPFPEELNRRLISRISTWNYAPTERAKEALLKEQVTASSIEVTGNTGIDSFLWALSRLAKCGIKALNRLEKKRIVLVTLHRRENLGQRLNDILSAISELATSLDNVHFVLPVHPNPRVAQAVHEKLANISMVHLVRPLGYGDLVWVMKNAQLIMTDSGGIQEEAPSLLKPVLVLREDTERPEAVDFGTSLVVGSNKSKIVSVAKEFLEGRRTLNPHDAPNPFGDGRAASRIVDHLLKSLELI